MRVLLVSKFLHHVGGVETYLRWQAGALTESGHSVALLGMAPPSGEPLMAFSGLPTFLTPERSFASAASRVQRARSAAASVYSPQVGRTLRHAIESFRPDVIHFHSTCYQLTPAVFREARGSGARLFLTAHEYKLVCANQRLFDDHRNQLCTACIGRSPAGRSLAILGRSCIKGAVGPSVIGAIEMPLAMREWRQCGGVVIAPSRFMDDTLRRDGRVGTVEYLDYPWPAIDVPEPAHRDAILYMARLAPEKGIRVALEAWRRVAARIPDVRFRIAGRGVEEQWVRDFIRQHNVDRVDVLGVLDQARLRDELARALVSVHPSSWFDNSPLSVRESLCAGVPAAVSDLGGSKELVGGDRGAVLGAHDVAGWGETMVNAATARIAGTPRFVAAVRARWFGAAEHVRALEALYAGHPSAVAGDAAGRS